MSNVEYIIDNTCTEIICISVYTEHSGHLYVGVAVLQHRTAKALPVAMFRTDI